VVSIGSNTTDAEQNQGLEGTDILVCIPQLIHVVVVIPTTGRCTVVAFGNQLPLLHIYLVHNHKERVIIEIHICQSGKQAFHDYRSRGSGQANQRAGQLILDFCGVGFLTAYACFASGSLATGGLLTLVTKHSRFPFIS
jgi:hypothetical protein